MKKVIIIALGLLIVLWSCSNAVEVKGAKKDEIKKLSALITDRILEGYNSGDYAIYSSDFDEKMKTALTEKVFKQTRQQIMDKIGKYKSRKFISVFKKGPYYIVKYKAVFEKDKENEKVKDKDKEVKIKVVLMKYNKKYLVSGLWFTSPKLMK